MSATTTNGTPAENEAAAKRVIFATDDKPPELPAEVPRLSRPGEPWGDFIISTAKALGIVDHSASLDAAQKTRLAAIPFT